MFNKMIATGPKQKISAAGVLHLILSGQIKLVIFDCDGVLANTEPVHLLARRAAIAELVCPLTMSDTEMLRLSKGFHNDDGILAVLLNAPETKERFKALQHVRGSTPLSDPSLTPEQKDLLILVKNIGQQKRANFRDLLRHSTISGTPGIAALMELLDKHNILVALASANEDAFDVVEALGLDMFFEPELIFTGDVLGTHGRHLGRNILNKQDMFEEITLTANCAAGQVIGFEDAAHGISAFQALGILAIGIDTEKSGEVDHADLILNEFDSLFRRK